jgi:hypothetical protein
MVRIDFVIKISHWGDIQSMEVSGDPPEEHRGLGSHTQGCSFRIIFFWLRNMIQELLISKKKVL